MPKRERFDTSYEIERLPQPILDSILKPKPNGKPNKEDATKYKNYKHVSDIPLFKKAKLGTQFTHVPTGITARLRRMTDTQTLEGTLYLLANQYDYFYEVDPKEWKVG